MEFQWTEDKYKKICDACDFLLLSAPDKYIAIANPWLHVIRAHPAFLGAYEVIFKKLSVSAYFRVWSRVVYCYFRLFFSLFTQSSYWAGKLSNSSDVLIISHIINVKDAGQENDFYYGDLSERLKSSGISSTIALINHTSKTSTSLAKKFEQLGKNHIVFNKIIGFVNEYKFLKKSQLEALRLNGVALKNFQNIYGDVAKHAADLTRQGHSIGALRLGEQIRELVTKIQPKVIIVTYEGHSWERLAFSASKSVLPNILCIGYQHTTVFYMQHALQRMLGDSYDPDLILTSGEISKNRLKENSNLSQIKIDIMGTPKSFNIQTSKIPNKKIYCIVLPEGLDSECFLLFSYSLRCAILMPNIEFIWRMHPIMDFKKFTRKFPIFKHLPPNISISNQTINIDLKIANIALYRGSTSIIQAVAFGIKPVYLNIIDEIVIDPLFEVEALRDSVTNPNDFKLVIENINNNKNILNLQSYCQLMYMHLEILPLIELVSSDNSNN